MSYGNRLKVLRKLLNLTQRQLAKLLDVSLSYITKLEREEREPSVKLLRNLSEKLSVNLNWLLTGRGTPFFEREGVKEPLPLEGRRTVALSSLSSMSAEELEEVLASAGPEGNLLLEVEDNCLFPYLARGDRIVLDSSEQTRKNPIPGSLFLVRKGLCFKRVIYDRNCQRLTLLGGCGERPEQLQIVQEKLPELLLAAVVMVIRPVLPS